MNECSGRMPATLTLFDDCQKHQRGDDSQSRGSQQAFIQKIVDLIPTGGRTGVRRVGLILHYNCFHVGFLLAVWLGYEDTTE